MEPWSADDPWQERRDTAPGWDEWPPPAPPADEYSLDEPEPPASDPWAESWADEVPGIPASPAQALERDVDRLTDAAPEPRDAHAFEPAVAEPQPEPTPVAEAEPVDAPRIEPWSPDPDPWGAAWTMPTAIEPPAEPPAGPSAEVSAVEKPPAAEREAAAEPSADAPLEGPPIADAGLGPAPEPVAAEELPELETDPEPALWSGHVEPAAPGENGDRPPAEVIRAWDAWDADIERVAEPEPTAFAPIWTAEPFPPAPDGTSDEPAASSTWEADLWTEPEADAAVAAGPAEAPGLESEPEPDREQARTEEADQAASPEAAAALADSRLAIESPPPEETWSQRADPTEVLPTTWAPPPAPPRHAGEQMEPRGGEIRTTRGASEPALDEDLGEEPTTAEQAVPWLIGVILLLAGMVIVLLALIFAGDASLRGAAAATPSPTTGALVPNGSGASSAAPSPTAGASRTPAPSGSAEADGSPAPAAEFGDLEMVYQGRSTALEPIYLLRRDFTVESDPEVVTQDADLDVRRFAWSPDGTRGAALYDIRLVGIDPRVAVNHLADDISAIAFGDDARTVYAVRVAADGDNDVASVLAIGQASGEVDELDRISYERPATRQEPAVAEAQFIDDGGPVRLYWMRDGTLRLWILGAGSWAIDPEEGNATETEKTSKPVLWAPEGERRIRLSEDGNTTIIRVVDRSGDEMARARVTGLVSHVRWSPRGNQVVFTLGRPTSGGGVLQDLYLWNLGKSDTPDPRMITNTGAAFGAEWLGSQPRWEEP